MRFVALMSGCLVAMLAFAASCECFHAGGQPGGCAPPRREVQRGERRDSSRGVAIRDVCGRRFGGSDRGPRLGSRCRQPAGQCLIVDASVRHSHQRGHARSGNRDDTSRRLHVVGVHLVEVDGGFGNDVLLGGAVGGYAALQRAGRRHDRQALRRTAIRSTSTAALATTPSRRSGLFVSGSIRGGFGADQFMLDRSSAFATIEGGPGRDVITGNGPLSAPVFGGLGNDTIDLPGGRRSTAASGATPTGFTRARPRRAASARFLRPPPSARPPRARRAPPARRP